MEKTPEDYVNQLRDDLSRQQRRIGELERQLAEAANGKLPEMERLDPDLIYIEPIVSAQMMTPVVVIRWFTHLAQVPVDAARELALNILHCAEVATTDALLFRFFTEGLEVDRKQVGQMILSFRNFRAAQLNKKEDEEGHGM